MSDYGRVAQPLSTSGHTKVFFSEVKAEKPRELETLTSDLELRTWNLRLQIFREK